MGCGVSSVIKEGDTILRYYNVEEYREIEKDLLSSKNNVGICFSSGTARSASLTLGQLRSLKQLGVLSKIRYISASSGSAWAVLPYIYKSEDFSVDETKFFGEEVSPMELRESDLKITPGTFQYSLKTLSDMRDQIKKYYTSAAEELKLKNVLNQKLLEPFGCGGDMGFVYNLDQLKDIANRNPYLHLKNFQVPLSSNMPYWIIPSLVVVDGEQYSKSKSSDLENIPIEFTPLFTGSYARHSKNFEQRFTGFLESFGFGSKVVAVVDKQNCRTNREIEEKNFFSLADVLLCTSLGLFSDNSSFKQVKKLLKNGWYPKYNIFSREFKGKIIGERNIQFPLVDYSWTGDVCNLLPMLRRYVTSLICFVNTDVPIIQGSVPQLLLRYFDPKSNIRVFKNSKKEFINLAEGLIQKKKNGEVCSFNGEYKVVNNEHVGVSGGWTVEILWIYNNKSRNFINDIKNEKVKRRFRKMARRENFPYFKDLFQNPPQIFGLKRSQLMGLTHLGSWMVMNSKEEIMKRVKEFSYAEY